MYNIESLIQRGAASVQLNTDGGVLGVNVQTINPQYPSQGTTDIDAALLRDVKATLSNNAMPSVGMCNTSIVGGKILIVAPNNCPLIEGENLVVISGVYLNTMFVWSVSVMGVTEEHLTADVTVTLEDGDITGILSAIEPDIAAGKAELAEAITAKGVETSADAALSTMADNVGMIQQESYTIDGGEMYAKQISGSLTTPNYWNLYEVLANLLSDGRLVNYGGILLAEYYRGYDSLALSGAGAGGAYVVSDKDGDGNFIMYTNDTTHTWNTEEDGRGNRWVAYCFADAGHVFTISDTNTCPRSIHIGRHVGIINCVVNGRVSEIVVTDGNELDDFRTQGYTQNWSRNVVIRNINASGQGLIYNSTSIESVYVEFNNLRTYKGTLIGSCGNLKSVIINAKNCEYLTLDSSSYLVNQCYGVNTIVVGGIKEIREGGIYSSVFGNASLSSIMFKGLEILTNNVPIVANGSCQNLYFPDLDSATYAGISSAGSVDTIFLGYKSNEGAVKYVQLSVGTITNIVLKDGYRSSLNISGLTTTSMTEESIYTGILQKLKQNEAGCGTGVTITLGSANLAKLTSEESVQLLDDLTNIYGYTFA